MLTETVKMLLALGVPLLLTLLLLYLMLRSEQRPRRTPKQRELTGEAVSAALLAEQADAVKKDKSGDQ